MMDIDETARLIHQTAAEHGFWDKERNFGEMLMLATSELAEALEEHRAGRPLVWAVCDSCKETRSSEWPVGRYGWVCHGLPLKPEGALVEIADAIIRLLDTGHNLASMTRFSLSEVIAVKMAYNDQREHMHGKAY